MEDNETNYKKDIAEVEPEVLAEITKTYEEKRAKD